jgi:thiol-disulfide isomerase/thioredoxin
MRHLGFVFLLAACAAPSAPKAPATALPEYELESVAGPAASLKGALGGSVGVLDLWATWCTACERERPKLARLDAAYRDQGLRVIGLNVGETRSTVSAYMAENRIPYAVYLDPEFRMADALGDHRLPAILVIDRRGRVLQRAASLDQPTLTLVKSLLAAPRK